MTSSTAQSRSMRTAGVYLRMTPEEKAQIEAKARAYAARTGKSMTFSAALREGAARYLDDLLAAGDDDSSRVGIA